MAKCKGCGAEIDWILTRDGKNMPVNPEPVYVAVDEGRDVFVTDAEAFKLPLCARLAQGVPGIPGTTYDCENRACKPGKRAIGAYILRVSQKMA